MSARRIHFSLHLRLLPQIQKSCCHITFLMYSFWFMSSVWKRHTLLPKWEFIILCNYFLACNNCACEYEILQKLGLMQDQTANVSHSWRAELEALSGSTFFGVACEKHPRWMSSRITDVFIFKPWLKKLSSLPWSLLAFMCRHHNKWQVCVDEPIFFIDSMNCDKNDLSTCLFWKLFSYLIYRRAYIVFVNYTHFFNQ